MTVDCCVFGCSNNNKKNPKLSFFSIPSVRKNQGKETEELTERRRKAWLKAINRKKLSEHTVRKWHVVCSEHFLTGAPAYMHDEVNPDWVPSLKLDYGDESQTEIRSTINRQKRRKRCSTADSTNRKVLLDANDAQSSQDTFNQQIEHDDTSNLLRLTSSSTSFSDDEAHLYDVTRLTESQKPGEENLKEQQRLNVKNMETEGSAQTCDQTDPLQTMSHSSDSKDHSVSREARVLRELEEPQMFSKVDVKRRTMSSGTQCPYCRYRCGSRFSFQIHVGSQHPLHCEDARVGRLGKVVFYQRTAKLFHCNICFFTSKDYAVLFEHLLARHCFTVKSEDTSPNPEINAGNEDATEQRRQETRNEDSLKKKESSVSSGEDEDEDVNKSDRIQAADEEQDAAVERYSEYSNAPNYDCKFCKQRCTSKVSLLRHVSNEHDVPKPHACKECSETFMLESLLTRHVNLQHRQERYRCPYCRFQSSLRGVHQHLSQCRAEENDDERDMRTEGKESVNQETEIK